MEYATPLRGRSTALENRLFGSPIPFRAERLMLTDFAKGEVLVGIKGQLAWVDVRSFPPTSGVWRDLDDADFRKLWRASKLLLRSKTK